MKLHCFIALTALCQLTFAILPATASAESTLYAKPCAADDKECLHETIAELAKTLTNKSERDQTYRELAKSWARAGKPEKALEIVPLIETPDTRAMAIRGIGMELAGLQWPKDKQDKIFTQLREQAEKLKEAHPPSYGIALTYIAMGQAFAGDNDGAWKTAADMENASLRHKAYGETAEIQAENGDYENAKISLNKIDDIPYKNKAYTMVSRLLAGKGMMTQAYDAAMQITNPYLKAAAIQNILDRHTAPTETTKDRNLP